MGVSPKLNLEEVIPYMNLPSDKGGDVNLWDFKQRKNLVIFLYHGVDCRICESYLRELEEAYGDMRSQDAEVVAVSFDSLSKLCEYGKRMRISFLLLSDEKGEASRKFTNIDEARKAPYPSVLVTDRYGALRFQRIEAEADALPNAKEVLIWLEYIQSECPECSSL